MDAYKKLLLANQAWAKEKIDLRKDYFERMENTQTPEFLWIGCSDSRVPAEEVTGAEPGELFVHRNIANLVVHSDINMKSVLQYAVEVLKVKHVVVCGHYGCGGVKAALSRTSFGLIDEWLRHIKDVYRLNRDELNGVENDDFRWARFVELNVIEQTQNVAATSIIQRCWAQEKRPIIHGWVYDIKTGRLNELITFEPGAQIDPALRYSNL